MPGVTRALAVGVSGLAAKQTLFYPGPWNLGGAAPLVTLPVTYAFEPTLQMLDKFGLMCYCIFCCVSKYKLLSCHCLGMGKSLLCEPFCVFVNTDDAQIPWLAEFSFFTIKAPRRQEFCL